MSPFKVKKHRIVDAPDCVAIVDGQQSGADERNILRIVSYNSCDDPKHLPPVFCFNEENPDGSFIARSVLPHIKLERGAFDFHNCCGVRSIETVVDLDGVIRAFVGCSAFPAPNICIITSVLSDIVNLGK
jgi:hypothetical protein